MAKKTIAMLIAGVITMLCVTGSLITGFVVSNAANITDGAISFYNDYYAYKIADGKPLFKNDAQGGGINEDVAVELATVMALIPQHQDTTWVGSGNERALSQQYWERTGKDFSDWVMDVAGVPQTQWDNPKSGGLFIKLFDSTGMEDGSAKDIADQWFQIVYTSSSIAYPDLSLANTYITFWMSDGYRGAPSEIGTFNGYSESSARTALNEDYEELTLTFPDLEDAVTLPGTDLPGEWQSQLFQSESSYANFNNSGKVTDSLTSYLGNYIQYNQNGMNSYQQTHTNNNPYMEDGLWLPSYFETSYMGCSDVNDGYKDYEENYTRGPGSVYSPNDSSSILHNYHRSGLWRLNGYDRIFRIETFDGYARDRASLRSTYYTPEYTHMASIANAGGQGASALLRPALHLNLSELVPTFPDVGTTWTLYQKALEQITELRGQVRDLEIEVAKILELEETIATLRSEIEELENASAHPEEPEPPADNSKYIAELLAQIEELTSENGLLRSQLDALTDNDEIANLESMIEELNDKISELEEALQESFVAYKLALDEAMERIIELLENVEGTVDSGSNGAMTELQSAYDSLYVEMQKLQKEREENEQSSNQGLDPVYIGLIVAVGLLAVGLGVMTYIALRNKTNRSKDTAVN